MGFFLFPLLQNNTASIKHDFCTLTISVSDGCLKAFFIPLLIEILGLIESHMENEPQRLLY